jgi:hypothetical protein
MGGGEGGCAQPTTILGNGSIYNRTCTRVQEKFILLFTIKEPSYRIRRLEYAMVICTGFDIG